MRIPHLAPTAVCLALALSAPAYAQCPASTFFYGGLDPTTPIVVVAPAADTTFSLHPCDELHGRFQVDAGLLLAAVRGCPVEAFQPITGLETVIEDDFTVGGLPAGTPVTFQAVLDLKGFAQSFSAPGYGGGGRMRGIVRESDANQAVLERTTAYGTTDPVTIAEPLAITLNAVAGTATHLRFAVRTESLDGRAELEGVLRFVGLPAGAYVQSCRGYDSGSPVPARPTSWGRLKAAYR